MRKHKYLIIIVLFLLTLIIIHAIPKPRYIGTGFISKLDLPASINNWNGKDITDSLDLDFDKNWNKFISEALIYEYINDAGDRLNFIILDAGNFHHPNVCFTAAGFEIEELADTEFNIADRHIKAHTLFTTKANKEGISFYWIIIDKKIVESWVRQKMKQLYFSLFNRQRVGLMVRIDVPAKQRNIQEAILIAEEFLSKLFNVLPPEQSQFVFGE